MAKIDERLKQVRETSLTESRLNEEFLDWLKTKGPSYLLAVLIGLCVYLGVLKFRQYRANRLSEAWIELMTASLPGSLEDLAAKYTDVPAIANQATLSAADVLLSSVQADRQLGSGAATDAPAALGDEERIEYLTRAKRLYQSLVNADDASLGATLRVTSAMTGLAAVAESQGDVAEAKRWYDKAAGRAEKFYPNLGRRLHARVATVDENAQPATLPAQASLPPRPVPERREPATVEEPLRDLLFPGGAQRGLSDDLDPGGLIAPGGKVDRETLLALYEQQAGEDDQAITVRFKLARDLQKRLDRYLCDRVPFLSRTSLQRIIREQAVTVNGRPGKPSTRLRSGDEIVAILPPPPSSEIPAEEIALDVLFEDDDMIVLNKRADIIVHPARSNRSGTLINALAWHFQHGSGGALSSVGAELARPGVVHRLDRHTTGAVIFAKSEVAHWRLARQFELRRVNKRYLAVVHGQVEALADVIDLPMGRHPSVKEKYAVRFDETGKPSVTIYRVREQYQGYTLLELELKTGRTHQIRVHLAHLGYPVVGDDIYGGKHLAVGDVAGPAGTADRPAHAPLITRQALHAARLALSHPLTKQPMVFLAPLHEDLRELIVMLRKHRFVRAPAVAGTAVDLSVLIP